LPIWLDGTSNGLQHVAMLGRDSKLAEWVNLNPRYDPQEKLNFVLGEQRWLLAFRDPGKVKRSDIYDIIAKLVRAKLYADHDNPAAQYWLDLTHTDLRDVVKRPIMTLPYGATKQGMYDQIKEECVDLGKAPHTRRYSNFAITFWR